MDVKIYTTPTCGYCHQAKAFLQERGVPFTEFDVSRDREAAREMVNLTGQMGVPVIVIDGSVVIGFDRPKLESLLSAGSARNKIRLGVKITDAAAMSGALIGAVGRGGLGERAGLASGDVVTEINGLPVRNARDMERLLAGIHAGDIITIKFNRGGKPHKAEFIAA